MITISGLTKHQCRLLDIMWNIPTVEQYEEWKSNLSLKLMDTVCVLEELVLLAELDEITDEECGKAKKVLDEIMKK
jgi:hypothetical protein